MNADLDLTGRRVGRYEIRSLLGSGGMGAVYRAYDASLDRNVAVKILPPHLVSDVERVRRFVQEAKSASALNHPNVISIYEIGEDVIRTGENETATVQYIAMELVEGLTLRDRMISGGLDVKRALTVAEQIADAIGAAHEAGVVHRDLKPENVILSSSGYVKVLDFGLAKLLREPSAIGGDSKTQFKSTEPGRILGTVGYMSPEQAEGHAIDHRSDIFSLGCILYEMIAARSPFRGRSGVETLHNIVHVDAPPLSAPSELQRIVGKSLAKAPEDRYQSAKDLAVDLRRLLRELDSNPTLTTNERSAPARVRSRKRIAIVAVALVAIVAIAVLLRTRATTSTPAATTSEPFAIRRITSTGNVIGAAISPDGKYIAYVHSEQGQQSLWLRQLATGQDLQLVAPADVGYWGHAFSPDGNSVYYAWKTRATPRGALYAISILGGNGRKILDGIDSPVSFSPDGTQFTYVRGEEPSHDSSLVIANVGGTNIRVLKKRSAPQFFYPNFYTGPAWSPDGKRIAVAVLTRQPPGKPGAFLEVDVTTGTERVISGDWDAAQQAVWTPDGKALIVVGARGGHEAQVWRVPWPSGEARPITNDLFTYRMPTITADGATLVAVATDIDADLWHVPLEGGEAPKRLRGEKGVGFSGLTIAPDGSIVYSSLDGGSLNLFITDAGGVKTRQLTSDPGNEVVPRVTPDGMTIVFGAYGGRPGVWRIPFDGSESRATEIMPDAFEPALSPDGSTIVFRSTSALMKMPLAGGPATTITTLPAERPAISPDGTRIACYCTPAGQSPKPCILSMENGAVLQTLDLPPPNFVSMLRWTPDGKALLVNTTADDRRNVWRIPLDGGEPKALTNFSDRLLFAFELTPDGKAFVASRGEITRDAVTITGFR